MAYTIHKCAGQTLRISKGSEPDRRPRAGNRICDIAPAFISVLAKYGLKREGRMGYSIGLSSPPDWGERTASIRTEDATELKPGMTFHFMPALWMDTRGLETTATILINDTAPAKTPCIID